ncbi:MAG: aminoacyl-tRNA hydrolase [Clostridia bacterium]|nr:aminoacyl-tRNA hydrolase [Clostridia bacterium]
MGDIFEILKRLRAGGGDAAPAGVEWIVAGLGNPGREYEKTRHNAGFLCLGDLAERYGVSLNRTKFKALTARCEIAGKGVLLLCPLTYMNLSGESVRAAADYYHVPPSRIIAVCDDIYRDVGRLKIKRKGSDGGHKGLASIIYQLESDAFPRIKIGVGAKPEGWELADWVLSRFSDDELEPLTRAISLACDGIPLIIEGKTEEAMQKCNL